MSRVSILFSENQKGREPNLELSPRNILIQLKEIDTVDKALLLGVYVGIEPSTLRSIEKKDNVQWLTVEIIDLWLRNSKKRSWGALAEAVEKLGGHEQLASRLIELESNCRPEVESNQPEISGISILLYCSVDSWC